MLPDFAPSAEQEPELDELAQTTYENNMRAARTIAHFIHHGHMVDVQDLPPAWQPIYQVMLPSATGSRRARRSAFNDAIDGHDFSYEILTAVLSQMPQVPDRTEKNRVFYSTRDALHPPPTLEWTVEGLLPRPSLSLLVGDPGTKKSYAALDLAVCVALGKPWLGHPTPAAPVIFIDEEAGLHQLWGRLNAVLAAHGATDSAPLHFTSLAAYNLRDPDDADQLLKRSLKADARLIIFDGLASLLRGAPDNNFATVQPVLFQLRLLAEACRASILILHHTNKEGGFRGTSAISAAADLMLQIQSDPGSTLVEFSTLKARYIAPTPFNAFADFAPAPDGTPNFQLHLADDQPPPDLASPPLPAINPSQSAAVAAILEYLNTHPQATFADLIATLPEKAEHTVRNTITYMLGVKLIVRVNEGSHGKKAVYALRRLTE